MIAKQKDPKTCFVNAKSYQIPIKESDTEHPMIKTRMINKYELDTYAYNYHVQFFVKILKYLNDCTLLIKV